MVAERVKFRVSASLSFLEYLAYNPLYQSGLDASYTKKALSILPVEPLSTFQQVRGAVADSILVLGADIQKRRCVLITLYDLNWCRITFVRLV